MHSSGSDPLSLRVLHDVDGCALADRHILTARKLTPTNNTLEKLEVEELNTRRWDDVSAEIGSDGCHWSGRGVCSHTKRVGGSARVSPEVRRQI